MMRRSLLIPVMIIWVVVLAAAIALPAGRASADAGSGWSITPTTGVMVTTPLTVFGTGCTLGGTDPVNLEVSVFGASFGEVAYFQVNNSTGDWGSGNITLTHAPASGTATFTATCLNDGGVLGNVSAVPVFTYATTVNLHFGSGGLLALGDSVAAGYGLDAGKDYPHLLGNQLGIPVANIDNVAVPGACASLDDGGAPANPRQPTVPKNSCPRFTSVFAQIYSTVDKSPSLITLTIGADDIRFDGCIAAIFGGLDVGDIRLTPLVNTAANDPCTKQNLQSNLKKFGASLQADLTLILNSHHGVPVVVTHYYNPLPPPVAAGGQACPLANLETISLLLQQTNLGDVVTGLQAAIPGSPFHDQYVHATQVIQGALYARAQYVIGALNAKIDSAVSTMRNSLISTVPLNFSNHDMCQGSGTAWAYGPFAHASLILPPVPPLPPVTAVFHVGPLPSFCPNPDPHIDTVYPTKTIGLGPFGVTAGFSTNCIVHPTQEGQSYIAAQILRHLG